MSYKIIYEDDSELNDFESFNKGYRMDVAVIIGKKKYKLYITNMIRLHQDFDTEIENGGLYQNEPNTVIVKEVSKEEIEKTISELYNVGFFDKLGYVVEDI